MARTLIFVCCCVICGWITVHAQVTQPYVAIHDSELTRALENMNAASPTPTGAGTTGKEWWPRDWHYFVMPESVKEALRSDGTAFTVIGDSNITSGILLTNGQPKYPIVISLASEAIRDDEIAPFTNYVAAGGFLLVGSSAFSRNTNGTTRGDFAFSDALGLHLAFPGLTNWSTNTYFYKLLDHRIDAHIPSGQLTWRIPTSSEEINWGISPSHPFIAPHDLWHVTASDATVLTVGDFAYPILTVKQYGKGWFIYCSEFQPLIGHSGFAPTTYSYLVFRRAIEWAFEAANIPVPKLSPWPYQYDSAFMVRHDLENFTNEVAAIEASAGVEFTNGVKGDYYFCTGTLRDDASPVYNTNTMVAGLRRAVTNYGATIGPHNGGLKNPNNPSLVRGQYDYWHWGTDEALDVIPPGYPSGKAYATASLSNSFRDVESWLTGITNGLRSWVQCYFNGTREDSYDLQAQVGVNIAGDQKLTPFPHWTLSTLTPNKRYSFLSEPVSDWFVGGLVAQSLEPWHPPGVQTTNTMRAAVDFYHGLGALINFYSHAVSTGLGDAGPLLQDYIGYVVNTNLHPRSWSANGVLIYQWWLQRSNAHVNATYSTNGLQSFITLSISGSTSPSTAVEVVLPGTNQACAIQVLTNNILATGQAYRVNGQTVKLLVGTSVTNAIVGYYSYGAPAPVFLENFDGITAPALPSGWTSTSSGAQSAWVTQAGTNNSSPNAAFSPDPAAVGLNELVSPVIALPAGGAATLSFMNYYDLDQPGVGDAHDGAVLEIKIGANAYQDLVSAGGTFVTGGYNSIINTNFGSPLAGRMAWSGTSLGFIPTIANLPSAAAGQNVQLRWRCATDSATSLSGWRIDSVTISNRVCSCCIGTNTPPVLPAQTNRTVTELVPLTVTNTAADSDFPANAMFYSLSNPPAGASIDFNGVITWTPSEAQGPGSFTITTVVTDSGFPPLSATNSFNVTVNEVNTAPSFIATPANRTVNELALMTVTDNATDPDLPANTLTYSLVSPPAGASISGAGVITWTPNETQGPSTNNFVAVVSDGTVSVTNSFVVTVSEVNTNPVFLATPANQTITPLTPFTVTNSATDSDVPANSLTYSLLNPPVGASISPTGGVITWTPTVGQDHSTNLIRSVVTDNGSPPLSATNTFTIFVNDDPLLSLNSVTLVQEYCLATNNALDPGEAVTVLFSIRNTGLGDTANLVATLLQTNGVVAPGGPQTYGVVVAGGAPVAQPFTFANTGTCGGSITAVLQLQDGPRNLGLISNTFSLGLLSTVFTQNFDSVTAPALPSGWTTSATGAESPWFTTNAIADTAPNAAFSTDGNNTGLNELDSPSIILPSGASQLSFRHSYSFESDTILATNAYDGGVLEIKIGTNAFTDITNGGSWVANGYNRKIDPRYTNPLSNRWAWSGTNSGYVTTTVNLPAAAAGQAVQFRWRVGADNGNGGGGWRIDSVSITGNACCANTAPVLTTPTNFTIAELSLLIVTNTAVDSSSPSGGLTYALVNPPSGANIDTNGIITWTPTEAQGPSVNTITTVVSDNAYPPLSATNSFTVTVTEVNSAPVLTVPADQTINELATLNVSASAVDSDSPANTLVFSLISPPIGVTINTNTGDISWTPTEAQGPSTNTITVRVTDNGSPNLSDTESFTVTVNEVNAAPVLTVPANQTINELATLNVQASATDSDIPANTLVFSLVSAPSGVSINTNSGAISWTPTEGQGPSTNTITVRVTDNGSPNLSDTESFTVTVNEVNTAPVLTVPANQTINELATLNVSASATDADLPTNTLSFSLLSPPSGMTINTNTGAISWTPSEAQGPSTNTITVRVTDNGSPNLSDTKSFTVTVNEVNAAPVLTVPADQTIDELTVLNVSASATDSDLPTNSLVFSLLSPPAGMTINTNTGAISWTPTEAQGPSTNTITVVVTDNGSPNLSDTNTFTVLVNEVNLPPVLPPQPDRTVAASSTLVVTNTATDPDLPANHIAYTLLSAPSGASIDTNGIITWTSPSSSGLLGDNFVTVATDDGIPPLSVTNHFTVTVDFPTPTVILSVGLTNGVTTVTWSSVPGRSYRLEYKDNLTVPEWNAILPVILASATNTSATNVVGDIPQRFYQVMRLP